LPPKINLKEMQIIQSIKDRGGVIMAILIAIALISFILMDSKSSGGGSISRPSLGKINGNSIDDKDFEKRVKAEEAKQAQSGRPTSGAALLKIREDVWKQVVEENVFYAEAEKLGISLTPKELSSILLSNDQANPLKQFQAYLNGDGTLDVTKAREALTNFKKAIGEYKKEPDAQKALEEQRYQVDAQIIEPLKLRTAAAKYIGLLNAAAYYPTWMRDKDNNETKNFATITYTSVPYSEIPDSTIVVKDEEINAYVAKRKDMFKQEAGRTISYLSFSQLPTATDSTLAKGDVEKLKEGFVTAVSDTATKLYLARSSSAVSFQDEYLPLSRIQSTKKDTIIKQTVGSVFGPYVEGDNYAFSKILGTKQMPDSVNARHILIALQDRETGKELMSDSAGKKLADSILAIVNSGGNFAALATQYSADPNKDKGGDLGTFGYGGAYPGEFNEFCFSEKAGQKKVIRSQVGYQIVEITNQTNFKTAYKIAILAKPILASNETFNATTQAATKAALNKDAKSLEEYAKKSGLGLIANPTTIKENDYTVADMEDARKLVKWAFDAKLGQVSDPMTIGNNQVVATVTKIFAEGTQDAATAKPMAEAAIKNEKKAAIIITKIGTVNTVEEAAAKYGKAVQVAGADSSIVMSGKMINGLGAENKLIGAAFNKDNQTKVSAPIAGVSAVYVIKVNAIQPKAIPTAEQTAAQVAAKMSAMRQINWFEPLKKQASITDNRSKFF
jgi:peptidyl-prolyl cis-trans isomerase D